MVAAGPGIFRRTVIADASARRVNAAIEDDFHHYEILLEHDGAAVTAIEARSHRTPWTTCHKAEAQLDQLLGQKINIRPTGLPDPHFQCTHMFELAVVAIAQAVRGGRRRYDVAVPWRELEGAGTASLLRNGRPLLEWDFEGDILTAPSSVAGKNLRALIKDMDRAIDDDMFEAVCVLRRSIHVSGGRSVPFETYASAADIPHALGACFIFQPERVAQALKNPGSRRDFSKNARAPLEQFPIMQGDMR